MDSDKEGIRPTNRDETSFLAEVSARWIAAMAAADVATLRTMMADDIVVTHGSGRTVLGRDAVVADVERSLQQWRVEQRVEPEERVVSGEWAFERARVVSLVRTLAGGDARAYRSRTWTLLRRDPIEGWLIARVIGVIEAGAPGVARAG
jgi:ketosteroid isomerase-like protein